MKNKIYGLLFLTAMIYSAHAHAQGSPKPLDGRQYQVDLFIKEDKDSHQSLVFQEGTMTFSEGATYGFKAEPYKCKQKNDSTWTFLTISESKKNGTMTWDGKVVNDTIQGTIIWTRPVENPINYTFKGRAFK